MSAITFCEEHKSKIRHGDAIKHNGKIMTVCAKDITRCNFFGIKIFGDSYNLGYKPVLRVKYNDPITESKKLGA